MKLIFLNSQFFIDYPQNIYNQFITKPGRKYMMAAFIIKGKEFGIPLKTELHHEYGFKTSYNNGKGGLDFTKAVIIDNKYILNNNAPIISKEEYKDLTSNEYKIKKNFEKYVDKYFNALLNPYHYTSKKILNFSTLQYYHTELKINMNDILKEREKIQLNRIEKEIKKIMVNDNSIVKNEWKLLEDKEKKYYSLLEINNLYKSNHCNKSIQKIGDEFKNYEQNLKSNNIENVIEKLASLSEIANDR